MTSGPISTECSIYMQLPADTPWQIPKQGLLNSELQFCNILKMGMQFQVWLRSASY